jgi:phosphohistidine swiveling domain-containing protein
LQSLAKKLGVEYLHTKFVTPEEMLSDSRETLTSKAEKRMNGWMVGHFYDGNLSIIDGPEAEEMVKELLPKQEENVSIIRGTTGCKGNGVVQGTVRILSRVSEIVKMKEGEILVSQMTTPEFVPAMRKAIAIITDEGGVTCHAAIVSRELNIPCVIGTGIATKILKDGDMVEVDADKGVVRIISVYKNMESSDFREIIKYSDKDEDYDLSPEYKYFRIVSRKTTILSRSLLQIGYTSNAFYEKQIGYKTKHRVFYDSFRGINVSRVGIDFERETALQNFANDKNFLLKIINRGEEVGEKLWEYSYELKKVDYKVKTDGELIKYCGEFFDLQAKESSFLLFPLSMQPWLESEIKKQIKEVINDEKVAEQYFTDLVTPIKSNFHYNEQESILKMATEYQVKGEISEEKITNYLDKYGSTALKYGVGNLWTKEEVVDRLKSIDKPNEKRDDLEHFHLNSNLRVEQILKELNASESLKNLVKIIRTYVWFRTFRTDVLSHSLANAIPLFDEIGRRNNLSWEEVLECFPNEILLFKFPTRDEISERSLSSINYSTSGTLYYQYGKKAVAIIKKLNDLIGYKEENTTQATESVSGVCAYKGKVIGIVRIVLTNKDINKVKRNDIIVASMTTPDFIPAMERASAFVTDEGGILCHAAIVSREMKKPCVIGTKIATQAFKDGDMIEVDADKGIVRIIK